MLRSATIILATMQMVLVNSFAPPYQSSTTLLRHHAQQEESSLSGSLSSGRVLPPDYFKSVYERTDEEGEVITTPWDIGGGETTARHY